MTKEKCFFFNTVVPLIDFDKINKEFPLIDEHKLKKISTYFRENNILERDDYNQWKMIKKCITILYKRFSTDVHKSFDEDEQCAWMALDGIIKTGICEEIKKQLDQYKIE